MTDGIGIQRRNAHISTDRSHVQDGRVFCRVERADIDVDDCIGCTHLRLLDGSGEYIVCDGQRPATVNSDQ